MPCSCPLSILVFCRIFRGLNKTILEQESREKDFRVPTASSGYGLNAESSDQLQVSINRSFDQTILGRKNEFNFASLGLALNEIAPFESQYFSVLKQLVYCF